MLVGVWLLVDCDLAEELQAVLSHQHLLQFIIERCSDVAPRFVGSSFFLYTSRVLNLVTTIELSCIR